LPNATLEKDFNENISDIGNSDVATGHIKVALMPYGADVTGQIETDIKLICDRCLEEFNFHLKADINEKFVKESPVNIDKNSKEIELKNEDFAQVLNQEKEIDITDLVYQTIILTLPFKKICRTDCKGIESYIPDIEETDIDPRLEIFKKLSEEK